MQWRLNAAQIQMWRHGSAAAAATCRGLRADVFGGRVRAYVGEVRSVWCAPHDSTTVDRRKLASAVVTLYKQGSRLTGTKVLSL